MPKCPECKERITTLDFREEYTTSAEMDKHGHYNNQDDSSCDNGTWRCPECGDELFDSEREALQFLNRREN
jgi:hypothetical protein